MQNAECEMQNAKCEMQNGCVAYGDGLKRGRTQFAPTPAIEYLRRGELPKEILERMRPRFLSAKLFARNQNHFPEGNTTIQHSTFSIIDKKGRDETLCLSLSKNIRLSLNCRGHSNILPFA